MDKIYHIPGLVQALSYVEYPASQDYSENKLNGNAGCTYKNGTIDTKQTAVIGG